MIFSEQSSEGAVYRTATFTTSASGGRDEVHVVAVPLSGIYGDNTVTDVAVQLRGLAETLGKVASERGMTPVFKRLFLSDIANQAALARDIFAGIPGALSLVGQPPLSDSGVKAALLAIAVSSPDGAVSDGSATLVTRGRYTDLWATSLSGEPGEQSREATDTVFSKYEALLSDHGMSLSDNCIRTWFYVRDIDNRYSGMVASRNEAFSRCGLTTDTHFIASTGIEGNGPVHNSVVSFDAVAVKGLRPGQVTYLNAPGYLNPTSEYGVAFERATAVDYGDRRIVYVSGTASIDNRGRIVARGDIAAQTRRMTDNVTALLEEGGCGRGDVSHIVVYIRDIADRDIATRTVGEVFPGVPVLCVNAAVCRPGWLVEMECMAIVKTDNGDYAPY